MSGAILNKNKKTYWKRIVFILICFHLFFLINLFTGKNTPKAYFAYKKELNEKQNTLNKIIQERSQIVKMMELLNNKNVDMDLLEELLRDTLQLSLPNETMVLIKNDKE